MKCLKCASPYCVKAGFNPNRQRYKRKNSGRQFTQTTGSLRKPLNYQGYNV